MFRSARGKKMFKVFVLSLQISDFQLARSCETPALAAWMTLMYTHRNPPGSALRITPSCPPAWNLQKSGVGLRPALMNAKDIRKNLLQPWRRLSECLWQLRQGRNGRGLRGERRGRFGGFDFGRWGAASEMGVGVPGCKACGSCLRLKGSAPAR